MKKNLKALAKRLEREGTHGDSRLLHVNKKELKLFEGMRDEPLHVNPKTGLLAAYEDSLGDTQGDVGSSSHSGTDNGGFSAGVDPSLGDYGGPTMGFSPGSDYSLGDYGGPTAPSFSDRGIMSQVGFGDTASLALDALGQKARNSIQNAVDNPVQTLVNLAVGAVPGFGMINGMSSFLGGPSVGGAVQGAVNSMFEDPQQTSTGYGNTPGLDSDSASALFQPAPTPVSVPTQTPVNALPTLAAPQGRPQGAFQGWPAWSGTFAPRPWMG